VEIRDTLLEDGYAAVFSEDIGKDFPKGLGSLKSQEMVQAVAADAIVVIIGSPGSLAEFHDFSAFLHGIGPKMLVFTNSRHARSYSFRGALSELNELYGNVATFRYPRDIKECHLLGAVRRRLKLLRMAKWRAKLR
jgi:hypothetical protein